jgi:hypothetical protein
MLIVADTQSAVNHQFTETPMICDIS